MTIDVLSVYGVHAPLAAVTVSYVGENLNAPVVSISSRQIQAALVVTVPSILLAMFALQGTRLCLQKLLFSRSPLLGEVWLLLMRMIRSELTPLR